MGLWRRPTGVAAIATTALCATVVITTAAAYVPSYLELPSSWKDVNFDTATLLPLELQSNEAALVLEGNNNNDSLVLDTTSTCLPASTVIAQHTGTHGCLLFAIRRPGWVLCREEGAAIATLAARNDTPLAGFGIFGVVKEVGVDDVGLTEFYDNYFTYPIYKDESLLFYNALGIRQLSLKAMLKGTWWNPYRIYKSYRNLSERLQSKNITGNMKGEGFVQGGIIIFDKAGVARYAYREETGSEIPIRDILLAIQAVRDEDDVGGQ